MARPTTLRPSDGGEIVLKGCSKETVENVKALLAGRSYNPAGAASSEAAPAINTPPVSVAAAPVASPAVAEEALPSPAIGAYRNPLTLNWHICEIKFSPYSKKATVVNDKPLSQDKYECDEAFKIKAIHMGLVG